jgi:hypothetical protein
MDNHEAFAHEIYQHLWEIAKICERWGLPQLAEHVTLILRDPDNSDNGLILGASDLGAVVQFIQHMQDEGIREA